MKAQPLIRPFEPRDLAAVEECMVELQEAERAVEVNRKPGREIAHVYIQRLLKRLQDEPGALLVAEVEGYVVGFVAVYTKCDTGKICPAYTGYAMVTDLVVLNTHRGLGIGAALLASAEAHARGQGARVMSLEVLSRNEGAVRFYEELGYDRIEIHMRKVIGENPYPPPVNPPSR